MFVQIPLDVAAKWFPEIQELIDKHFIETCNEVITEYHKNMLNIDNLKKLASRRVFSDHDGEEENLVVDWVGTHVDDAFSMGSSDGETQLARQILDELGEKYEVEEE
jgi:hypothetical protein